MPNKFIMFCIKVLIVFFVIFVNNFCNLMSQDVDTCLPKGFTYQIDSSIIYNWKKLRISNIDFSEINDRIIIAEYPGNFTVALINKNNKWETVISDSIELKNNFLSQSAKRISFYTRIKNKIYCLFGGRGFVLTTTFDSISKRNVIVDTLKAKSYIKIGNLDNYQNIKRVQLDDYYANKLYYFENYGWIVISRENVYKYSMDFDTLYEKVPNKPSDLKGFTLLDSTSWYAEGLCHAVSPDTIYFNYMKYIDTVKNAAGYVYENVLFRTTNGCKTFEKINLPIKKLGYIYFIDGQVGFYSGQYFYYDKEKNNTGLIFFIYKTNDGGSTWQNLLTKDNHKISINDPYFKISNDLGGYIKFYNKNRIGVIVSGFAEIYISYDYGNTWKETNPYDPNSGCDNRIWLLTSPNNLHSDTIYLCTSIGQRFFTYYNPLFTDVAEETIKVTSQKIYPNPISVGSKLKIEGIDFIDEVNLYDLSGIGLKFECQGNEIKIPNGIVPGFYVLQYRSGEHIFRDKLILR